MCVTWSVVVLVACVTCVTTDHVGVKPENRSVFSGTDDELATGLLHDTPSHLQKRSHVAFYDDFSSGHIDSSKWSHDVMAVGLGGFQIWSPESRNSYVKNGMLFIKPTLTTDRFGANIMEHGTIDVKQVWGRCSPVWGSNSCVTHGNQNRPVMSAQLRSSGSIKYGKVEVVAKMPKGDWIWPGIWMMPTNSHYGGWPRSGEIDIIEAAGNVHRTDSHGKSAGIDVDWSHLHYGPERDGHKQPEGKYWLPGATFADNFHTYWLDWTASHIKLLPGATFADTFHTYWLDWTASHIKIGVDHHTVLTINTPATSFWNDAHFQGNNIWAHGAKNAPFDQEFHLILTVAVANGFFWEGFTNHPYPRPWTYNDPNGFQDFWKAKHLWYPTWHGEDAAMKIKSVKMVQY